ncbi:hypothetical protein LXA43DRAFT_1059248 [Ganoderma leucocontextum]|nr:hypothetical protein LXA43DRAFT_1059248 [Ganoderma leucocontextum]
MLPASNSPCLSQERRSRSPKCSATPRQLETYPSYGRDFGRGSHEEYAKPEVVKREFERVHERIDEEIAGLETRLTTELQRLEGKIDQLDMKFESRLSQLQLNLDSRLDTHFESIEKRFPAVDDHFNDHFNKIDDRFNEIDQRFDKIEEDIREMKQMLTRLLEGGVVPATPLHHHKHPSLLNLLLMSSSLALRLLPDQVRVPVAAAAAGPQHVASPSQQPFPPQSSGQNVDPGSLTVAGPSGARRESVLSSIRRKASKGLGLLNKSKERGDQ